MLNNHDLGCVLKVTSGVPYRVEQFRTLLSQYSALAVRTVGRPLTSVGSNLFIFRSSVGRKRNDHRGGLHHRTITIRKIAANTQNQSEQGQLGRQIELRRKKRGLQRYNKGLKRNTPESIRTWKSRCLFSSDNEVDCIEVVLAGGCQPRCSSDSVSQPYPSWFPPRSELRLCGRTGPDILLRDL